VIRASIAVAIVLSAGCVDQRAVQQKRELAAECLCEAAYRAFRAEHLAATDPEVAPQKCCGECGKNGLPRGKVLSGDKQKVVPCPCPDTCQCKSATCVGGSCRK
jgi:hypothetical protein